MYALNTEFLSERGWLRIDDIKKTDKLANYQDDSNVTFIPASKAGLTRSTNMVTVYNCKIGNRGCRICVTPEHKIRFFKKKLNYTYYEELKEVLDIMEITGRNSKDGLIPRVFKYSSSDCGFNAKLLSSVFHRLYKISANGDLLFTVISKVVKRQLFNKFIELGVPVDKIAHEVVDHTNCIIIRGWRLEDWYRSIIDYPVLLGNELVDTLSITETDRSMKMLRYHCPHLANIAQLALTYKQKSTKITYSPHSKSKDFRLSIEPTGSGATFRNSLVVIPKTSQVVATNMTNPITRFDGSIISL